AVELRARVEAILHVLQEVGDRLGRGIGIELDADRALRGVDLDDRVGRGGSAGGERRDRDERERGDAANHDDFSFVAFGVGVAGDCVAGVAAVGAGASGFDGDAAPVAPGGVLAAAAVSGFVARTSRASFSLAGSVLLFFVNAAARSYCCVASRT